MESKRILDGTLYWNDEVNKCEYIVIEPPIPPCYSGGNIKFLCTLPYLPLDIDEETLKILLTFN